jgi:hypothetical protein
MADDNIPDQNTAPAAAPAPKPKRSLPWGYLVIAVLILGAFGVIIAKPDLPRSLLAGDPPKPEGLGDGPAAAGDVSGGPLSERELAAEMAALGPVKTSAAPVAAVVVAKTPDKPAAPAVGADETRAAALLAEAETAYAAMEWDKAESAARKGAGLNAKPATKGRLMEIERGAPALRKLFKELEDRDELARNWETHPSLVKLVKGTSETFAVPIASLEAPYSPILDNPVGFVERGRNAGKIKMLVKGSKQFTPAEMDVVEYTVMAVDQAAVREDNLRALASRDGRVRADKAAQRDPTSWYELGKFAYRNRIDDKVVAYLDKAVQLDPFLARNVRETTAGVLFGSMVAHMKNGNKQQAASFMASIERRYKDTDQAKQARFYYDGKQAELVAAAREAEKREKEEAAARRQTQIDAARKKGDEVAAKQVEQDAKDEADEETAAISDGGPVSGEIAAARELRDKGAKILGEAMNMPATDERNHKYAEAATILTKAKAAYNAYCEKNPSDSAAEAELVETGKMLFSAKKNKTL